ncbi:unnamed protein product [Paramecium sonneborni]|uniref:Transmembrane protein n=1 Tax=Paramecium sonneborni TaxID=65129 RepID=A0A8S1RR16_9CILI|nr:unnamed protein product [Paramecium sonneborni]
MTSIGSQQMISKIISLQKSLFEIEKFKNPNSTIQFVGSDYFINTILKIFYLLLACIIDIQLMNQQQLKFRQYKIN